MTQINEYENLACEECGAEMQWDNMENLYFCFDCTMREMEQSGN